MSRTARAFWAVEASSGEIRFEQLPVLREGEVLVRTLFSGVSRGTETLVFGGRVPRSEFDHMRAPFQAGDFTFPVKYGYANVGCVVEGQSELVGRNVFCLYPHQTAYVVPAQAVVPLPEDVPPARGVLAANMETALNALWDARPLAGDRIGVVGAGTVGCLFAYLAARIPGTEVTLIDVDSRKAAVARALRIAFALPSHAPTDLDCVAEASGAPDGLQKAIDIAGREATVLELSWFGDRPAPLRLGEGFFTKRLRIRASQVGTVSPNKPGFSRRMRLELSMKLLCDGLLDALFTGECQFEELPETMRRLASREFFAVCHRVRYD